MDERDIVIDAQKGDAAAFTALVARYRRRAVAYFASRTRDSDAADDLCQEAFLKAFLHVGGLRSPERFGAWFFSICRNCLRAHASGKGRDLPLDEEIPGRDLAAWESFPETARASLGLLEDDLRQLVTLRHECGLSYAQTAAAAGIPEPLVKSRLFRARERLRAIRCDLEAGILTDPRRDARLKEAIMENIGKVRKSAWLVERLSLRDQQDMARGADANAPFGERLLSELAAMEGGKEWIRQTEARLSFGEFVNCLNYVDRHTEMRLVDSLDIEEPELAEKIKRSLFVFEDFILFDPSAISVLAANVAQETLAMALSGADNPLRRHFLSAFPEAEAEILRKAIQAASGAISEIEEACFAILETARALDQSGDIRVMRPEESDGRVFITAGPRGTD
jgi:RNA polymerase sigma factor (sigma-70 family)